MSQELKAQAEQRGEVVGEIVGEFRDAGGWTPNINWQCSGDHPGVGTKLYTAPLVPAVPDDLAKDAARWRFCESHPGWLRQVRKGKAMWFAFASPTTNYEHDIYPTARDAVDAAMLAAAPEVKP